MFFLSFFKIYTPPRFLEFFEVRQILWEVLDTFIGET